MTPVGIVAVVGGLVALVGGLVDPLVRIVDAGVFQATGADLLRLVAVPVFGWAAWRDMKTRRIPNETWRPLVVLGVVLFSVDAWAAYGAGGADWTRFVLQAGFGIGFVVPLAYLFWRIGGFGGADVKAVMVLAILFPTYPAYLLKPPLSGTLPWVGTPVDVFSFTILTNAVLAGAAYPIAVTVRNALAGRFSRVMFVGRPVSVEAIPTTYGRLLERPDGTTRRGLDLDALRMYLRWRGLSLSELRADPDRYRDPATLPAEPNDPTDGNVRRDGNGTSEPTDGGDAPASNGDDAPATANDDDTVTRETDGDDDPTAEPPDDYEDPWGAEAFLDDIEGTAYGTRPDDLQDGLEVLARAEAVWVSPGLPFVVPLFVGLVTALVAGDLFFALLDAVGAVGVA